MKKVKELEVQIDCYRIVMGPGWCGPVDCVLVYRPKGHRFDSLSGHMPGMEPRSLVGGMQEGTD